MFLDNIPTLFGVAGGLGVFLLGMIIMTENLRLLGGNTMRKALRRFTRNPATGAMTGAVCTAMLQSSSATTVAAVGFVGAGLLPFTNALGIIFGANIGTTITGWLVALLGFKLSLGSVATLFIFAGVMMRLFRGGRVASWGLAIAGFGLIFVGISTMQDAMAGLEGEFTPSSFPPDTWLGRLQLFGAGFLLTVVTQSSSAGVALAMTALNEGTINFTQAAALVIGMDVGTTLTALLASIGATASAKRTGVSHVVYNFLTACGAMLLITPFVATWQWIFNEIDSLEGAIGIAAFHTTFNTIGVIAILPFARPFGRLMERIVPEPKTDSGLLDHALIDRPPLALEAVRKSLQHQALLLYGHLLRELEQDAPDDRAGLQQLRDADDALSSFLDEIDMTKAGEGESATMRDLLHSCDHLGRLIDRCEETDRIEHARRDDAFEPYRRAILDTLPRMIESGGASDWRKVHQLAREVRDEILDPLDRERDAIIERLSRDAVDYQRGSSSLEVVRWFIRSMDHIERIAHYLDTDSSVDHV